MSAPANVRPPTTKRGARCLDATRSSCRVRVL
jgi:hypothetical protein